MLENVLIVKRFTLKYSGVKCSVVCILFPHSSEKNSVCMCHIYLKNNYTIILIIILLFRLENFQDGKSDEVWREET